MAIWSLVLLLATLAFIPHSLPSLPLPLPLPSLLQLEERFKIWRKCISLVVKDKTMDEVSKQTKRNTRVNSLDKDSHPRAVHPKAHKPKSGTAASRGTAASKLGISSSRASSLKGSKRSTSPKVGRKVESVV